MIVKKDFDRQEIAESMSVLWELLTADQRQYLVGNIKIHVYEKNEAIYRQGETPAYIMCLLEGKVKVYINGVGGRTQIIRMIEQMDIFAYRAAFVNEDSKTSASAFETSTVCMIPIAVMRNLIEGNNELAVFFIRQLSQKLGEADALTVNLTQKHMRGRLAESLIALRNKYGYDFYSLHFYLKDIGFVKSLAAGDYKLSFGRGLVVNNSLFMGKSIYSASVQTRPAAIRKHFSSDEYNFFRGLAATMGNENVEVSLWLSRKKADATTEGSIMTALKKDGRHRTQLDMQKKHAVTANAAGANITFRKDFFKIGLTAMYASFDKELKPDIRKYNMFYPQGKDFFNISADYDFLWQGIYFSGETALDKHMNIATVNMINMSPAEGFRLFLLHRYYSRKYASLYANAFSSGSMPNNEHGLFASMELQPLPRLSLYLSGDFYIFPWIKYSANKLKTKGTDITAKADWMIRNSLMLTADYRFRHGEKNRTTDGERSVRPYHSHLAKLKLSYSHSCGLAFGSVVAYRRVSIPLTGKYNGFLFMQSVVWQVPSLPLELCANYGQFDTDDYEARIYSYESSFIRSLYSPALYGDGTRLSCSARFTFKDRCAIAFRYSHLLFNGEKSLGSGADMIDGNKRDELNISMKFRF